MSDTEESEAGRSVSIFGRDITKIPCFRKTFLYSISGGFGTGLLFFLLTSRVGMATHVGFGSFVGITFSYWFYCRYQWSKDRFAVGEIQHLMKQQVMYEGTELEKNIRAEKE